MIKGWMCGIMLKGGGQGRWKSRYGSLEKKKKIGKKRTTVPKKSARDQQFSA